MILRCVVRTIVVFFSHLVTVTQIVMVTLSEVVTPTVTVGEPNDDNGGSTTTFFAVGIAVGIVVGVGVVGVPLVLFIIIVIRKRVGGYILSLP